VKRHKVRALIGVVVLLLAAILLTGFVSPPFAEAEVPLFIIELWGVVIFFGVILGLLIGFVFLVGWILRKISRRNH